MAAEPDNLTIEYPPDFISEVWDGCSHLDCLPACWHSMEGGYCVRLAIAFAKYQTGRPMAPIVSEDGA